MIRLLLVLCGLVGSVAAALVPEVNARVEGSRVLARNRTGGVVWSVPVPRWGGRVGVRVSWINSWISDAVIITSQDAEGSRWFTLLDRGTGRVRWQGRGAPLTFAAGLLLVRPDVPSGYPNRWTLRRYDVATGRAEPVVFRYDRPRRGCGTMTYSGFGPADYAFPFTANPRLMVVMAADQCGDLELTYDWTGRPDQTPRVRALPCLNDAFQSIPCARTPR